jgi:hypothetical protein
MNRWSISGLMTLSFVVSGLSLTLVGKVLVFFTDNRINNALFVGLVLVAVLISMGAGMVSLAADLRRMRKGKDHAPRTISSTLLIRIGRRLRGRGESGQRLM